MPSSQKPITVTHSPSHICPNQCQKLGTKRSNTRALRDISDLSYINAFLIILEMIKNRPAQYKCRRNHLHNMDWPSPSELGKHKAEQKAAFCLKKVQVAGLRESSEANQKRSFLKK